MNWNIRLLKKKIKTDHGIEQCRLISPCLDSLYKRQEYARYHFRELEQLLEISISKNKDIKALLDLMSPSLRGEYDKNKIKADAHLLALMQSMHCIPDTLAHVIYFAFAMNFNVKLQVKETDITIHNVKRKFEDHEINNNLVKLISILIENESYKYLNAAVNHSKHRNLISTYPMIDFNEIEKDFKFVFTRFEYKNKIYEQRGILDFVELEYDRQSRLIVEIGIVINEFIVENTSKITK